MAKNYKRHTQGIRFKRANFGDMGLRAYQEQQKTIIDAMKLQAAQHKKVRDDYLASDIDKARKERENRKELKALEDAVWDNKELNEKIRADREIDALKAKGDDYARSAAFWKDFSTTYSKQYAQAFDTITDAIDLKYAQKIVAQQKGAGGIYEQAITNSKILNNISSSGIINEVDKIYTDPKNNGHFKRTEHAHSLDIEKRRSSNLNTILSEQLIQDSDKIITHLKDELEKFDPKNPDKKRVEITKDNIEDIIQQRSLEIMGNLGMDPNSEGGKKFLEHMWNVATDEAFKRHKIHWAKEDEDTLYNQKDGLLVGLKANIGKDKTIEWEDKFNHTIKLYQYRYVVGEDGEASLQEMNVKQAYSAVQDLLINEGIITRENFEKLNIAFPGQARSPEVTADPTLDTRKLMWQRHPDLRKDADASLLKKEKADNKQKTEKEKIDDAVALTKIQEKVKSGDIDPNNSDQIGALINGHPGKTETLDYLNKIKVFNPKQNDSLGYVVNANINSAYNNNDYRAYKEAMQYLGKEDRQKFNEFTKRIDDLNRSGGSAKEIKTEFEKHVKADLKLNELNDAEDPTVSSMIDVMQQDFYFQERKFYAKGLRGAELVDAAIMEVKAKYKEGTGLYLKEGSGNSTVFPAMKGKYDPSKAITREQLDKKLNEGGGDWNNLFKTVEASQKSESPIHILDQDWVERNLRNTVYGKNIESNETIDYLYYTQPIRDKMFSKTEILNKYLAAKGIKTQVPLGALDKVDRDVIKNAQININNYHRMSDENKMRMKTYLETGVMLTAKPKDVQNLEKNDQIRKNYLNSPEYKRTQLEEIRLKQLEKKK